MCPYDGLGSFSLIYSWPNDKTNSIPITASRMQNQEDDIAANGLSNVVTRDGQSPPTANLPMGGFKLTGAGSATGTGEYITLNQYQTQTIPGYARFAAKNSANQTVTSGSPSTLTCAEVIDPAGIFGGNALTVPTTGVYELSVLISAIGTTITILQADIIKVAGTTFVERAIYITQPATSICTGSGTVIVSATAGDVLIVQVTVTGTGTLELRGTGPTCQYSGRFLGA